MQTLTIIFSALLVLFLITSINYARICYRYIKNGDQKDQFLAKAFAAQFGGVAVFCIVILVAYLEAKKSKTKQK
jgi:hypothetical protein